MASLIFDASAPLAILNREPAAGRWADALGDGCISAVNFSEVVAKLADLGMPEGEIRQVLDPLGLEIVPFDPAQAWAAGMLRPATRTAGLSLGDRACLALARLMKRPVLTSDRSLKALRTGVMVHLVSEDRQT